MASIIDAANHSGSQSGSHSGSHPGSHSGSQSGDQSSPITVASSYATLAADDLLSQIVSLYTVEEPLECVFWQRGVNDTYQVHCANACYSLRVYRHKLRELAHIKFELAALLYLQEQGASISHPIEKRTGGYITQVTAPEGLRYAILTTHAEGDPLDFKNPQHAKLFGESAAMLHHHSEGFSSDFQRPAIDIDNLLGVSLAIVKPHLARWPEDLDFVEKTALKLQTACDAADANSLDTGFCHGDFHGANIHHAEGRLTHFDFDCCGMGRRVFDLATFNWSLRLSGQVELCWLPFLEGYRSVREISDTDQSLIDTFVIIRHFWLMALHMGNARDFGHSVTSDGYIKYQLGFIKRQLVDE